MIPCSIPLKYVVREPSRASECRRFVLPARCQIAGPGMHIKFCCQSPLQESSLQFFVSQTAPMPLSHGFRHASFPPKLFTWFWPLCLWSPLGASKARDLGPMALSTMAVPWSVSVVRSSRMELSLKKTDTGRLKIRGGPHIWEKCQSNALGLIRNSWRPACSQNGH